MVLYVNGHPVTMDGVWFDDPITDGVWRSLFSWSRAREDDELLNAGEKYGWWGNLLADDTGDDYGSRLWTLMRTVDTEETRLRARDVCEEALRWMIDDGLASEISADVEHMGAGAVAIGITITLKDETSKTISIEGS